MGLLDWFSQPNDAAQPALQRCIVLDVETSGLDAERAQLLAVACVAVQIDWPAKQLHICPGDSLEITLQPTQLVDDVDNILLHGIGSQRQQSGLPLWQAMPMIRRFIGDAPLIAFHAWFDKALILRHFAATSTKALTNPWVDIEKLCSVLHPDLHYEGLDAWLVHYNIPCTARHEAAADCMAECELLQRIWPLVSKEASHWKALQKLEKMDQWLSR
jgi:DNA polymerase III subunit epsilon